MFSFFNTAVYCIPGMLISVKLLNEFVCSFEFASTLFSSFVYCACVAGWVWGEHGFLNSLGAVDIAGSGPVSFILIRLFTSFSNCHLFVFYLIVNYTGSFNW